LYGLLDVIVDGYFDAVEVFDDYYDDVSEGSSRSTPLDPSKQQHWFEMRQALVRFHRLALPMREAISGLMRREHGTPWRSPCTRTSRTCTTTCCASPSRPTRCATWSARSSRPT
jgi:Mg2+ and Co2+ transporter CorA